MVTVVIPAFNEEKHIGACLEALENQTLSHDQFEVILVDNGSTDRTLLIAHKCERSFALRTISRPNINVAGVRNAGASLGRGDIIAFLDADCIAGAQWLSNALQLTPTSGIWGAHYLVPSSATWIAKTWFRYQAKEQEGPVSFIPSSNMFIRHRDFDSLQGFDETVRTSEDVELCARARDSGMPVTAFRSLAVVHEGVPKNLSQFYRQNRWHGAQLLKLFFRNLPSTRNFPIIAISFYTLLMLWAMIVAAVIACIFHDWYLPALLLLLFLLPSFVLSVCKTGLRPAIAPLMTLYTTYLLARAAALMRIAPLKSWKRFNQLL